MATRAIQTDWGWQVDRGLAGGWGHAGGLGHAGGPGTGGPRPGRWTGAIQVDRAMQVDQGQVNQGWQVDWIYISKDALCLFGGTSILIST